MPAYDPIADWYAAQSRTGSLRRFHDNLAQRLLGMAGDVSGKKVLDAGCGEGHVARLFARHGARVVAVDISPRLLEHARQLEARDSHGIEFVEADLARGLPSHTGAFDLATANMMLDDCQDLAGVLRGIAGALKPNGRLLLSMNNPYALVTRGKVHDYFASGPLTQTFGTEQAEYEVPFYYRTFEEWVAAFRQAGFLIRSLVDVPSDPGDPHLPDDPVPKIMLIELVGRAA
ncbi:MAG: methyltransferase domain-containing protein [Chloroflexota bacterium]|nr:methyltransferase domain-containing protein [Chloroflexota bacterium]MDE2919064.1 methyltransferase domain-containing protein [Chloroflexota bacterium]